MLRLAAVLVLLAFAPCRAAGLAEVAGPAVPESTLRLASDSVLRHTSGIVGIAEERISESDTFARQVVPADDLDIVEIVMAVEDELGISIDDSLLATAAGDEEPIADHLTVRQVQHVVAEVLSRKQGR